MCITAHIAQCRRFLVFPEDANVPHLRSALFVLGAGALSDGRHSAGDDAQASAAPPFSFAAAEVRGVTGLLFVVFPIRSQPWP